VKSLDLTSILDEDKLEVATLHLDDRLNLSFMYDPSVSIVKIDVVVEGGLTDTGRSGFSVAHLCEHLIARHGVVANLPIGRALSAKGAIIQASTHPFHTEYQVVVPVDDSCSEKFITDLINFWLNLDLQSFDLVAIETEIGSIEREIDDRLLSGPSSLFPWSEMFSTVLAGTSESVNLLLSLPNDLNFIKEQVELYTRSLSRARVGVSVVGPIPIEVFTEELRQIGYVAQESSEAPPPTTPGISYTVARSVVKEVDGLQKPLYAEIFPYSAANNTSFAERYAAVSVAASILNHGSAVEFWRVGAFDPYSGPDSSLLIYAAGAPLSMNSIPENIDSQILEKARRQQISILNRRMSDPAANSRHLALSFIFGITIEDVIHAVNNVSGGLMMRMFDDMRTQPRGQLTWLTKPR
jgi:predicted Zn-dependent peptidase